MHLSGHEADHYQAFHVYIYEDWEDNSEVVSWKYAQLAGICDKGLECAGELSTIDSAY
jgi:hypothetical protein